MAGHLLKFVYSQLSTPCYRLICASGISFTTLVFDQQSPATRFHTTGALYFEVRKQAQLGVSENLFSRLVLDQIYPVGELNSCSRLEKPVS